MASSPFRSRARTTASFPAVHAGSRMMRREWACARTKASPSIWLFASVPARPRTRPLSRNRPSPSGSASVNCSSSFPMIARFAPQAIASSSQLVSQWPRSIVRLRQQASAYVEESTKSGRPASAARQVRRLGFTPRRLPPEFYLPGSSRRQRTRCSSSAFKYLLPTSGEKLITSRAPLSRLHRPHAKTRL